MRTNLAATALLTVGWLTSLPAQESKSVRVTVDNFARAETDMYFGKFVKVGGFVKFHHDRELAPIDKQTVIRMNRDTLYSFGVFDLDASPVTITLPDAGKRFMALMVVNEDHYVPEVVYKPGAHTFTKDKVGTRYVGMAVRTFVNPNDPADVKAVHALQDAIKVVQKAAGKFEVPAWDPVSHKKVRDALLALTVANGGLDSSRMFGRKDQVDPVQHLLGTAAGWGGNPREDALYAGGEPKDNDGKTAYRLTLKDVPVDGFWSVSVYNKDGFFEKNARNAYTLNNVTAKPSADGSVTIHLGGDENAPNYLPITPGWNYTIRLYRPRKEVLDGTWKIPEAQPVK
jgi:hypothetical protein